ncbi:MAG TPA: M28 family peptidase [Vicinamibacterales bacterium]|nr:M28 family peptidase [Vicinamibacterales bacterium]
MIADLLFAAALGIHPHAQAPAPPTAPPKFEAGRAWDHLRQFVAIGPRPSGSAAIEQTRTYIKDRLAADGLAAAEQTWDEQTPFDKVKMTNLVVTIPGARRDRIVVTGHYDTKRIHEFRFVGASDGASSAAFLLELARVLKGRKSTFTYELVFLDGEEAVCKDWDECARPGAPDNTYGSRHYVTAAKRDGTLATMKAMILIDMIGDRDLDIRRDGNSTPWLTDIIWSAAKGKSLESYFLDEATRIEDDHLPFLAAGVPSVDIIDLDYEAWHTSKDNLDAVSARSLQVVGDVVIASLPAIEARLVKQSALVRRTGVKKPRKAVTTYLVAHHPHGRKSLKKKPAPILIGH